MNSTPSPAPDSPDVPNGETARGLALIAGQLRTLPQKPGVYRMLDAQGDALYVGKARNLRRRVTAYTQLGKLPNRLQRMVVETRALEVVTTHTEVEALLLEINLIKKLRPRYNVLLRDDKSFPYIFVRDANDAAAPGSPGRFPRVMKYRGARSQPGQYFGPFASAGAVNRTLNALQRVFLLRSCSDNVFSTRSRPCLLYQIKRCSAPCVGRIAAEDYDELVEEARGLPDRQAASDVQSRLAEEMQRRLRERLDFEIAAALIRDRIRALSHIQSHQDINLARHRRRRRHRRPSGSRPHLRPGLLLPGRPQLRQPCLLIRSHDRKDWTC